VVFAINRSTFRRRK